MKTFFVTVFLVIVVWAESLLIISQQANYLLPYQPSFPYADQILQASKFPKEVYSWANFDGVHYITIARKGYWGTASVQAFFPLYPLVVRMVARISNINEIVTGLFVSLASCLVFLFFWFSEIKKQQNEKIAWKALLTFLLFPTAFFLLGLYTESFFLLWYVLTWIFVRKKQWLLVALCIAAASATRVIGVLLVPAVMVAIWEQRLEQTLSAPKSFIKQLKFSVKQLVMKDWLKLLIISSGILGIGAYMWFLQVTYQDPLAFFHVQNNFGAGRQTSLVLWPQVAWRSLKILTTVAIQSWKYLAYVQETAVSFLFLILLLIGFWKRKKLRLNLGELTFCAGAFFLPPLTGTFSSMPRYVLVCLPLFIVLTQLLKSKNIFIAWLTFSTVLLIINTVLFIQGYWVA